MAWESSQTCITLTSHADYSSSQYRFVTVNSSGSAELTAADGDAIGILQNNPGAGEAAVVAIGGVSKLYIGTTGSLAAGSIVASEAAGAGILTNASAAALAIALEDSTANGDIISVVVTGANGKVQAA
jgi:hypothetical protein